MEKLRLPMLHFPLFVLQILSLLLLSSAFTPPTTYFMNCGSKSNITVGGREFIGDLNSGPFSVEPGSTVLAISSPTDKSLYETARIFKKPSSYEFDITDTGIHYVRIHFFPFISGTTNLGDARFDVSTTNFSLLSNFGVAKDGNLPVIEEFLLTLNGSKFFLHFTPHSNSLAFVNAIEVFRVPDDFVSDDFPVITSTGSIGDFQGTRSQVLRTIHRVNVGGPQNNDTLWRNWITDDNYLLSASSAKTCVPYKGKLTYDALGGTDYSASVPVYTTCRELASDSSKVTWGFPVNKNARYLARFHFCDIVSKLPDVAQFDLLIFNNFNNTIYSLDPINNVVRLAAPFYWDFLVDSENSGLIYITIGPRQDSAYKNAYLNGVEVLEFMKSV